MNQIDLKGRVAAITGGGVLDRVEVSHRRVQVTARGAAGRLSTTANDLLRNVGA